MNHTSPIRLNNLLYTLTLQKQRGGSQIVLAHTLTYIINGEMHLYTHNGTAIFKAGNILLLQRNQLLKQMVIPEKGGEFKAVSIVFDEPFLRRYAGENHVPTIPHYKGNTLILLPADPFLKSYFDSLLPYFSHGLALKPTMAELKTTEAVELLLSLNPQINNFLFDFAPPQKAHLETYMHKNYFFNIPVAQFAKLTGRSLATFKRDFEKIFNAPPSAWLQQKRLNEAYRQIKVLKQKPLDVYHQVGFENLSHFSYAFKKAFGVPPSMLL